MPIELYTGKPGNGKTALMMERLVAEAKRAARPIFASGIDGLQPGLATVLEDPRRWNDLTTDRAPDCTCDKHAEPHAHVLPNGALWFVDEAWKWFGHLHDATRQATPPHVLALAEHRHRGIDMIWTTQGPGQIYPFARPLIADHRHCVRRFGTSIIDVFHWEELQEDVKSAPKREAAQRTTRALPKAVFGTYKSADLHTIKARVPLKVWALPVLVVAAGVLLWFAVSWLRPDNFAADLTDAEGSAAAQAAPSLSTGDGAHASGGKRTYATVEDYIAAHQPRIATLPWSAPIYDGRDVTSDPQVYCMASEAGTDAQGDYRAGSCRCTTEQGTPYALTDAECRMIARHGPPYNPYRERRREADGERVRDVQRQEREAAPAPATAAVSASPLVQPHGGFGADAVAERADVGEFQM